MIEIPRVTKPYFLKFNDINHWLSFKYSIAADNARHLDQVLEEIEKRQDITIRSDMSVIAKVDPKKKFHQPSFLVDLLKEIQDSSSGISARIAKQQIKVVILERELLRAKADLIKFSGLRPTNK